MVTAMSSTTLVTLRSAAMRSVRNPHFWVLIAVSAWLLFIYRAWPWPDWRFDSGVWRLFPWLSVLESLALRVELKYHIFGVLFLIPITYGSLALSWRGGIFAWCLALTWSLPTLLSWSNKVHWIGLALLLLPVLLVAVVNGERRWRDSEKKHFAEREEAREAYITKLIETQEAERRRIAQEIHDEALQTLMVIATKSEALAASADNDRHAQGNTWIKQELVQTMDGLRRLSMNLRPSILDNFGLVPGVRWLINNSNAQNGCRLAINVVGLERKMLSQSEITVFRVVQEAINNIQRHARARNGSVTLDFEEDRLVLVIVDDGIGFRPPDHLTAFVNENKLGIIGMEQRIASAGGEMEIDFNRPRGTRIWASIPYDPSIKVVEGQKS